MSEDKVIGDFPLALVRAAKRAEARAEAAERTLAERDAEIARLSALTRPDAARGFPANTCPASRHAQMIGEELFKGEADAMLTEDPRHLGESILATVAALWETRAERDTLRAALATREAELKAMRAVIEQIDKAAWKAAVAAALNGGDRETYTDGYHQGVIQAAGDARTLIREFVPDFDRVIADRAAFTNRTKKGGDT